MVVLAGIIAGSITSFYDLDLHVSTFLVSPLLCITQHAVINEALVQIWLGTGLDNQMLVPKIVIHFVICTVRKTRWKRFAKSY